MERGTLPKRCAAWGGASLGIGTLAFALFSPSNAGCSTNLVVLTHGTVTARGCAASSLVAHLGIGLMVLGAVLLLGSFALVVRTRRQVSSTAPGAALGPSVPPTAGVEPAGSSHAVVDDVRPDEVLRRQPVASNGAVPHGTGDPEEVGPMGDEPIADVPVALPPGWYGNPDTPGKPVQWWDGTRLIDRPSRAGR